jgi:ATP-dependent Lon protease
VIKTTGYSQKEKLVIATDYLLPKIREQIKFSNEDIIIPEKSINYIVEKCCKSSEMYSNGVEPGVRNLKRCLEIIHAKLNLFRLMKSESNLLKDNIKLEVQFPFIVTTDAIDKLLPQQKNELSALNMMYA